MILVINGTNRPNNRTQIISKFCFDYLQKTTNIEIKYLSLEDISNNILHSKMYEKGNQEQTLSILQQDLLIPISNWLIISPEYNGSFPGILKLFIDALSINQMKETFNGKYMGLIGTSDGRAGNFRGMEHLTGLLNYLKVTVYHNKLPISSIANVISENGEINEITRSTLKSYLDAYIKWLG